MLYSHVPLNFINACYISFLQNICHVLINILKRTRKILNLPITSLCITVLQLSDMWAIKTSKLHIIICIPVEKKPFYISNQQFNTFKQTVSRVVAHSKLCIFNGALSGADSFNWNRLFHQNRLHITRFNFKNAQNDFNLDFKLCKEAFDRYLM